MVGDGERLEVGVLGGVVWVKSTSSLLSGLLILTRERERERLAYCVSRGKNVHTYNALSSDLDAKLLCVCWGGVSALFSTVSDPRT